MIKKILSIGFLSILFSCISTKSTIKNTNEKATIPIIINNNHFVITEIASNKKYGYHPDYPINTGFTTIQEGEHNDKYFLNALKGPQGETLSYEKTGNCCPFPSKKTEMGVGLLTLYQIKWKGLKNPITLYFNSYEKGDLLIPIGLTTVSNH